MKDHLKTTTSNCFVFYGYILFAIQMKSCNTTMMTEDETEFKIGLDVYRPKL